MFVREDFRRDGLAANFMADSELINIVSSILEGSKINIGYPAICNEEYQICSNILEHSNNKAELCVVGHAREEHLKKMADITKDRANVSANSWMPISDYFLNQTVKVSSKEAFNGLKSIIKKWKKISNNPFDIAFADCTSYEKDLPSRIFEWTDYCLNNGVRNVIICDTRGMGSENQIDSIFEKLNSFGSRIEYHPHNDNGKALNNIDIALKHGVKTIGTAFYNAGERLSMIDPRSLIDKGLFFNNDYFPEFEDMYIKKIGHPEDVLNNIYGTNIIVTGSQYRLRDRDSKLEMRFGVTTDTHIASEMIGKIIEKNILAKIKDEFLYKRKRLFLDSEKLIKAYGGLK